MKKIKKIIAVMLICILAGNVLTACDNVIDDRHRTKKEAQDIAKEVVGEDVTYVETIEYEDDKKVVYIFKDSREHKFAIISTLIQQSIDDGATFGPDYCRVTDSYPSGVFVAHKDEIKDILKKYQLDEFLSNTRPFDVDISKGEGVVGASIDIRVDIGAFKDNYEKNADILKRVAAAGAEIDALLALKYNGTNMDVAYKGGYSYDNYGVGIGILLTYVEDRVASDGKNIKRYDTANFKISISDDTRWTEEKLYQHLKEQLDVAIEGK